jgi:NAD(P)-dependent dehydrogenase (short-subunit alcohol dehydrogenase family)
MLCGIDNMSGNTASLGDLLSLEGKVALITGATSGVGLCVARLFLRAGAHLAVTGATPSKLEAVLKDLQATAAPGQHVAGIPADTSKEADVLRLFGMIDDAAEGIDILVNCVGIYPSVPFLETTVELWERLHQVNNLGAYLCNREAIRRMKAQGRGGSIVNISSVSAVKTVVTGHTQYGSSKAGVNMMTQGLAYEYGPDNIRVNAVMPGSVDTEGLRSSVQGYAEAGVVMAGPVMQQGRQPIGRVGTPADIANACLFLASPASSYITGQLIAVDGGFSLS